MSDRLPASARDYPYAKTLVKGDTEAVQIVGNWCTAGGRNPDALVRDYLASITPQRLADVIKASWKVEPTRDQLVTAAAFYREQVL